MCDAFDHVLKHEHGQLTGEFVPMRHATACSAQFDSSAVKHSTLN